MDWIVGDLVFVDGEQGEFLVVDAVRRIYGTDAVLIALPLPASGVFLEVNERYVDAARCHVSVIAKIKGQVRVGRARRARSGS